jgi:uncharacterized damage-inducible protein DinB
MNTDSKQLTLATIYSGWATYHRMLIKMISPLSPDQLAIPVSSLRWTVGRTLQHIAANRVWWFHLWMGEGSSELLHLTRWDPSEANEPPIIDADGLVAGLADSWDMVANALAKWLPSDLAHEFAPPKALSEEEQNAFGTTSRQWIIWHVFEHEIHHGGEISLALGKHGLLGIYGSL